METCKAIIGFWDSCTTTIMDILQFGVPLYVLVCVGAVLILTAKGVTKIRQRKREKS